MQKNMTIALGTLMCALMPPELSARPTVASGHIGSRTVRIKHCICSLAPAALTVTDEHAEMRGGARRAQRQLSEERTWSLCSAE